MLASDLELEPNEASDLCPVFGPDVLDAHGWDRAFVTVLDEVPAEAAIAVLCHEAHAEPGAGWRAVRVETEPVSGAGKTEDAEACARRDGVVYVLGSQFGRKAGPLEPSRSWEARVTEEALADALEGAPAPLEIARTRFGLHRAINDALAEAGLELPALGPRTRRAYIDDTIARGAAGGKRWAGRVRSGDHPINVEGLAFRGNGRALLGLRHRSTAEGDAILVELDDIDAVFAEPRAVPRCRNVWRLAGSGSADAPVGVRGLHGAGDDRFDAVVGNLDAVGKGATVVEDHPESGAARSSHVRFELPMLAGGGPVSTAVIHDFGDVRRVEGVVVDHAGNAYYVVDQEGCVELHALLVQGRG